MAEKPQGRPRDASLDARVVGAARVLLRQGGLDALSISEVALRSGVSRPAIYRRFPDRTALALGVLFDDLELRVGVEALPGDAPVVEQIIALFRPFFRYYAEDPPLSSALLQLGLFSPQGPWQAHLDAQASGFMSEIAAVILRAIATGEVPVHVDPMNMALGVFSFYLTIVIAALKGVFPSVEAEVELFRSLVVALLRGASQPAPTP